jgi:hypothetical protein
MTLSPGHHEGDGRARETPGPMCPSDDELLCAATHVSDAVHDGRLDLEEAGRLLSATYRARSWRELDDLVHDLVAGQAELTSSGDRAFYVWAAVRVTIFAATAAVLLFAVLHALSPS